MPTTAVGPEQLTALAARRYRTSYDTVTLTHLFLFTTTHIRTQFGSGEVKRPNPANVCISADPYRIVAL